MRLFALLLVIVVAGCQSQTMNFTCCKSEYKIITQNYNASNDFDIWIPQAFTPNGDGINDVFQIHVTEGGRVERLTVKKGLRTIYDSSDFFVAIWDGSNEDDGRYRYTAEIRTDEGDVIELKGKVCLMRLNTINLDILENQENKICDCVMPDMIDARRGIIYNSVECPTN